jgi:hypothetical protein
MSIVVGVAPIDVEWVGSEPAGWQGGFALAESIRPADQPRRFGAALPNVWRPTACAATCSNSCSRVSRGPPNIDRVTHPSDARPAKVYFALEGNRSSSRRSYAIDPTGIGRVLKLTDMGEIKQQLVVEAEADRQKDRQMQAPLAPESAPRSAGSCWASLLAGRPRRPSRC